MMIRFAAEKDIPRLGDLLRQVCLVHHNGRPDLFNVGRKYTDGELATLLKEATRPILVAVDDTDTVVGYCFCVYQQPASGGALKPVKTLYIDDLCVDETCRGQGIGKALYQAAVALARDTGCYNVTLNVWSCNPTALQFYERMGLTPQKIGMELVL
ncbi:MAG: GNAT family N-acetyltransferase [Ruminococcaceae bacterium]|nr:GNAT family N-acetyltransferase [Oscillospiraceae bacterium]